MKQVLPELFFQMDKLYTDWSLKNIIGNFDNMNFKVTEAKPRYVESVFTFNEPKVIDGSIQTFSSPNIDVSFINMNLKCNVVFTINDGVERAGSSLVLKGGIETDSIYSAKQRRIDHSNHMLVHSNSCDDRYMMNTGETSIMYLNLKPEFLQSILESDERIHNLFKNGVPEDICMGTSLNNAPWSSYTEVVRPIINNNFSGVMKHMFLEAKALELFSMQLNEMLTVNSIAPAGQPKIGRYDEERLHAIHTYINANFAEPLSMSDLVAKFGLNEFKLKKGYKQLFNNTVFGHIYELRMNEARRLLLTGEHNVSEVAYMVGYNNPYNFSTAFVRMFNYPPSSILRRVA